MAALQKTLLRTGPMKRIKFLIKMLLDGKVFGSEGQEGYCAVFLGEARNFFNVGGFCKLWIRTLGAGIFLL